MLKRSFYLRAKNHHDLIETSLIKLTNSINISELITIWWNKWVIELSSIIS